MKLLRTLNFATSAMLTGYLRDETTEMPSFDAAGSADPARRRLPLLLPREADPVAVQFLQAGYHVFTLIYSTDHAPLLWQPLTEAASAILYLRRNAADLRIAADKITIVGFCRCPPGGFHRPAVGCSSRAAGPWSAETGSPPKCGGAGVPRYHQRQVYHRGSFENLCGTDEALLQTMSLENQVRPDVPPFFIWHTVEDEAVPVENSLLLAGALKEKNNVPFELHLFTHGGHGSSTCTNEVNTPNSITTPGCPCAWAGWGRPWILPCDLSSPIKKLFL